MDHPLIEFQDPLPVVDDQTVRAYCLHCQSLRVAAVQMVLKIVDTPLPLDKYSWAALLLIQRITECQLSFELLIARGRERDAAVLLVTILELAFDLIYLEKHPDKIEEWIAHDNRGRKPWSVSRLIADIYDEGERAPMNELYRHCSMVKHGNPAGGLNTFPMGLKERQIILPEHGNLPMLTAYVFAATGEVHRALQSATRIWEKGGHDPGSHAATADKAWEDLQN